MIKRIFVILLIYASLTYAASTSSKHSLSILDTTSTRSKGMMKSGFLIGNDSSSIFMNAASLMGVLRDSVNLNYTVTSDPKNEYIFNASYAHIGGSYAVGVGFAGDINKVNCGIRAA